MKRKITVLSGLPGAGKSTYAGELRAQLGGAAVVINRDRIREMLFGYHGVSEPRELQVTVAMQRMALDMAHVHGYHVIVDDLTLDRQTRDSWMYLGQRHGVPVEFKDIDTPVDVCIERDAQRPQPVGAEAIRAFALARNY